MLDDNASILCDVVLVSGPHNSVRDPDRLTLCCVDNIPAPHAEYLVERARHHLLFALDNAEDISNIAQWEMSRPPPGPVCLWRGEHVLQPSQPQIFEALTSLIDIYERRTFAKHTCDQDALAQARGEARTQRLALTLERLDNVEDACFAELDNDPNSVDSELNHLFVKLSHTMYAVLEPLLTRDARAQHASLIEAFELAHRDVTRDCIAEIAMRDVLRRECALPCSECSGWIVSFEPC